jgi:pyruvate,water dikinase
LVAALLRRWSVQDADAYLLYLLKSQDDMQTSSQGITLWRLAKNVQASPTLQALFASNLDERALAERLHKTGVGRAFWKMIQIFLETNGARAAGEFELAQPRWQDDPSFVLMVIRNYVMAQQASAEIDEVEPEQIVEQMQTQIRAQLSPLRRHLLDRLVVSYGRYVALRENVKYQLIEGYAALRRLFLRMGGELVDQQALVDIEDVFSLYPSEIQAFRSGQRSSTEAAGLIAERRRQHDCWSARDAPSLVLDNGQAADEPQADIMRGIGCSPGVVEGRARVLREPADAEQLQPGEILVAPHTDPGWTPLFLTSRAVVTEIGGFLSHGATVAREYGVPAVFNVTGATHQIQTGDTLRVDGARGTVSIIATMR